MRKPLHQSGAHPRRRARSVGYRVASAAGFTLVELLVVITIIAIIGGITMGVMHAAQNSARKTRTKATIAKINRIIMERYESYQHRPVEMIGKNGEILGQDENAPLKGDHYLQAILDARRDLMRMEMPDRTNDYWRDSDNNGVNDVTPVQFNWGSINEPALFHAYASELRSAVQRAGQNEGNVGEGEYGSAECLYMIVMYGSPESRALFKDSEIGDVDEDGMPEFIDGWEEPIYWIRWAPGYTKLSRLQHDQRVNGVAKFPDPLDVAGVRQTEYQMIPLIYSGGPDREPGLVIDHMSGQGYRYDGNPYAFGKLGAPESDGTNKPEYHEDNISNHD